MTVFDPTVSGLRQKHPELLGILGNSWEGPGIVGKAPGLLGRPRDCWEGPGIVGKAPGLLDGWNVAVPGLRQKDPFPLYSRGRVLNNRISNRMLTHC
jgi:hypothetical protein